ncbi:MAG: FixH family protein [Thermodesulfovibrionia bacterium]|nr:FixH family protein [Thermodesulfovibrionia bacterium]
MKTIIIVSAIFAMLAVAGAIFVGIESFDGTVTSNPYEEGLRWDEVRKIKSELGWGFDMHGDKLTAGENNITITLVEKDGSPLDASSVSVMLSRPSTSSYDSRYELVKVKEGTFRLDIEFPLYGYWDIKADVIKSTDKVIFEKRVFVEKG